jgi:ribosome-binding protein aMBF1 (putative translation factor)
MAERGMSYADLARATTYSDQYLKRVARGDQVPSPTVVKKIDEALRARGELLALQVRAHQEQPAERYRLRLPAEPADPADRGCDSFAAIGRRIAELRENAGLTKTDLAGRLHCDLAVIVRAESGDRLSEQMAPQLDDFFGTGGELSDRRRRVVAPQGQTLGGRLRELREARGWTQDALAAKVNYSRSCINKIECGRIPLKAERAADLDRVFGTGSELVEWQARVEARGKAREVAPTDRRQALQTGGLAAADLSRRIARANPDALSLDEYEADIHRVAASYQTTPHERLAGTMVPTWRDVENILDDRISPRVRGQMTLIAGQYAFYLGYLGFDMGDDAAARRFLHLAGQHAAEADELLPARSPRRSDVTLLAGSILTVRSSVAYFTGRYAVAADIAAEGRNGAHPYVAPVLAACEARAAARAGRPDDARRALQDMQDTVWRGPVMPGPVMLDDEAAHAFLAVVNALLGAGEIAEPHARRSLELLGSDPDHYVQIGGTYNALCRAYLRRAEPDPEQAADAAGKALAIVKDRPNRSVVQQAGQMHRQMRVSWPDLPAVRNLGEIVASSRKALPPGQTA